MIKKTQVLRARILHPRGPFKCKFPLISSVSYGVFVQPFEHALGMALGQGDTGVQAGAHLAPFWVTQRAERKNYEEVTFN